MNKNQNTLSANNLVKTKETINHMGKFFRTVTNEYLNTELNHKIVWECFFRNNCEEYKKVYAAEIIAILKNSNSTKKVIIIENFRYPVEKKVLEFPSGMIDHHEFEKIKEIHDKIQVTSEQNELNTLTQEFNYNLEKGLKEGAIREFKEETGYVGTFNKFLNLGNTNTINIFKNMFHSPWLGGENATVVMLDVDLENEANINPRQNLEKDELIKVHVVDINNLFDFISEKMDKEDYGCTST